MANPLNLVILNCGEPEIVNLLKCVTDYYDSHGTELMHTNILFDQSRVLDLETEVYHENVSIVSELGKKYPISIHFYNLDGDFAQFRNSLNHMFPIGSWALHLDSDELVGDTFFPKVVDLITMLNSRAYETVDLIWFPRENYVKGITQEYIRQNGWKLDQQGRINFPDFQGRMYRLTGKTRWVGEVHERIEGFRDFSSVLDDVHNDFYINHTKTFEKQIDQNRFYEQLG
jgi:hypothetical protein